MAAGDTTACSTPNHSATIVHGNALQTDWTTVLPAERCAYLLGNPPFVGKSLQDPAQKLDMASTVGSIPGAGVLDYVAAWYVKAARYMAAHPAIRAAFVSTNSITQGEQVGALWGWMLAQGVKIHFAHRTFSWTNEARGRAAVHCVIVGFGLQDVAEKTIFEYEDIRGEAHAVRASNINPYLVDAPDFVLPNRTTAICDVPPMIYGSKPTDGGHLLLSEDDRATLVATEPQSAQWIKPFLNADEFLYNQPRYCLWLVGCPPDALRRMPQVLKRLEAVRAMRSASPKAPTRERASTPGLFAEIRQSVSSYLLVPAHTSENRSYIPVGYMEPDVICGNANFAIPNTSVFDFGVLTSTMHNAWVRAVCGRLESRIRYSASIVYNNFPWPTPTDKQRTAIEAAAQGVLDARAAHPGSSLADLYDPLTMPPDLVKAHQKLDAAVDASYGYKGGSTDAARVAFLFGLYQQITSLLPADCGKTRRARRVNAEAV